MIRRHVLRDGLVVYRSALLAARGVPHAFTTRHGGQTAPRLDTGRLDDGAVASLRRGAGVEERAEVVFLHQVHGAGVFDASRGGADETAPSADALVSDNPEQLLLVRTADCVPVVLCSSDGRRVAAVHAGWKGLLAGVLPAAVAGLGATTPLAAVGPCLSTARFEVGEEVAERFVGAGLGHTVLSRAGERPLVDLREAARTQLVVAGVAGIEVSDRCTWDHVDDFYSYRREVTHGDGRLGGRQGAVIAPRSPRS